jgi:hypothetical protein
MQSHFSHEWLIAQSAIRIAVARYLSPANEPAFRPKLLTLL